MLTRPRWRSTAPWSPSPGRRAAATIREANRAASAQPMRGRSPEGRRPEPRLDQRPGHPRQRERGVEPRRSPRARRPRPRPGASHRSWLSPGIGCRADPDAASRGLPRGGTPGGQGPHGARGGYADGAEESGSAVIWWRTANASQLLNQPTIPNIILALLCCPFCARFSPFSEAPLAQVKLGPLNSLYTSGTMPVTPHPSHHGQDAAPVRLDPPRARGTEIRNRPRHRSGPRSRCRARGPIPARHLQLPASSPATAAADAIFSCSGSVPGSRGIPTRMR